MTDRGKTESSEPLPEGWKTEAEVKADVYANTGFLGELMGRAEGIQYAFYAEEIAPLPVSHLDRLDWDFSIFEGKGERSSREALACMIYEFARESKTIRELVLAHQQALRSYMAGKADDVSLMETMERLATESRARWDLHDIAGSNMAHFAFAPGFPDVAWQALSPTIREAKVSAASIQAPRWVESIEPRPAGKFKIDFNTMASLAENQGMIPLLLSINPHARNWTEIKQGVMRELQKIKSSLPLQNVAERDAFEALTNLGMLRLRHRYSRDEACNKAVRDIEDSEWCRYRRHVCAQLAKLFRLPEGEMPLSFDFR